MQLLIIVDGERNHSMGSPSQQSLKSRAVKGKERGVAVGGRHSSCSGRALAAQARGPGFNPRRRHLSFFPFAVSKVYGQ